MDMNDTVATVRLGIMCMDMIELGCLYTELDTSGELFSVSHSFAFFSAVAVCMLVVANGRSH